MLVTRPAHQAANLIRLIEQAGGTAIPFPTIDIVPPADTGPLQAALDRLADFHLAVFVSPNAVRQTFGHLRAQRQTWPDELPAAAVGAATARALADLGVRRVLSPQDRFDSEALLALPGLQDMARRRAVVFRGNGGRELLGDTLVQRGAAVTYVECYRRVRPQADTAGLVQSWRRGEIHLVSVTSTEGLRNLYHMLAEADRGWLLQTPVVVLSDAQAAACRELGFAHPALRATPAGDTAILEAIKTWRHSRFSL